jgi:hypothetical protein
MARSLRRTATPSAGTIDWLNGFSLLEMSGILPKQVCSLCQRLRLSRATNSPDPTSGPAWKRHGTFGRIRAANKGFIGNDAVVSYLNNKETTMKLTAMALATAFALSSSYAFAHTDRHSSTVKTHPLYSDAARPIVSHPKYDNPNGNFSATGKRDAWGRLGAYYGPMIPAGAGGR